MLRAAPSPSPGRAACPPPGRRAPITAVTAMNSRPARDNGAEYGQHLVEVDHCQQHHHQDEAEGGEAIKQRFGPEGRTRATALTTKRDAQREEHRHNKRDGDPHQVDRHARQQDRQHEWQVAHRDDHQHTIRATENARFPLAI